MAVTKYADDNDSSNDYYHNNRNRNNSGYKNNNSDNINSLSSNSITFDKFDLYISETICKRFQALKSAFFGFVLKHETNFGFPVIKNRTIFFRKFVVSTCLLHAGVISGLYSRRDNYSFNKYVLLIIIGYKDVHFICEISYSIFRSLRIFITRSVIVCMTCKRLMLFEQTITSLHESTF